MKAKEDLIFYKGMIKKNYTEPGNLFYNSQWANWNQELGIRNRDPSHRAGY
jgi:hypothetical protein